MKLSKTQFRLLTSEVAMATGHVNIMWQIQPHRNVPTIGKRERDAALGLKDAGLIEVTENSYFVGYNNRNKSIHFYISRYRITEKGFDLLMELAE